MTARDPLFVRLLCARPLSAGLFSAGLISAGLLLAGLLGLAPATAAAQDDPRQTAIARALFEEGLGHFDAERFDLAVDRFRRSLEIRRSSAVQFNLAAVLARQGLVVEPRERFLEVAADPAVPDELREDARRRAAELEPRIARVTVRLLGERGSARVRVGSVQLTEEMIGVAVPVDPGTHEVALEREGRVLAHRTISLSEGGAEEVTLEAAELESAAADASPSAPTGSDEEDVLGAWWLWTIVGVVAAGLVVGAVVGGVEADRGRYFVGNVAPGQLVVEF